MFSPFSPASLRSLMGAVERYSGGCSKLFACMLFWRTLQYHFSSCAPLRSGTSYPFPSFSALYEPVLSFQPDLRLMLAGCVLGAPIFCGSLLLARYFPQGWKSLARRNILSRPRLWSSQRHVSFTLCSTVQPTCLRSPPNPVSLSHRKLGPCDPRLS